MKHPDRNRNSVTPNIRQRRLLPPVFRRDLRYAFPWRAVAPWFEGYVFRRKFGVGYKYEPPLVSNRAFRAMTDAELADVIRTSHGGNLERAYREDRRRRAVQASGSG